MIHYRHWLPLLEQADLLHRQVPRDFEAEMPPCVCGQNAATRRALDEALLDQIGFDDILDGVARFRQSGGDRLDPDRPASEIHRDHGEIAPVELVEAQRVDFQPRQRLVGDLA